jgi:WD40 repeat protein
MRPGRIHALLTDVDRLLLAYKIPIIDGALHVYWSALATMPSCLLLEETAPYDGHGIPLLVTNRAPCWGVRETRLETEGPIACIVYSPNGQLIASISLNGEFQIWDVVTGTALHTMSAPDTEAAYEPLDFTCVAFSPNGSWTVSGSMDCTVRLWDVVTGSQHHVMTGHTGPVSSVAFSPDGTTIVSGSRDGTLCLWNIGTSTEQLVFTGHTRKVNSLAFAPNGHTVVSASSDHTLRFWDIVTGTELCIIEGGYCGDDDDPYCVTFSPDGATIASGSAYGAYLWCATNITSESDLQLVLERYVCDFQSLAFSPDGESIASCEGNGVVRIWDVTTGIEKRRLRDGVATVAYSPNGKSIAMALLTGTIRIWDANTGTSVAAHPIPEGHQAEINSVAFPPDGMSIASGCHDQTVRIWDATADTERNATRFWDIVYSTVFLKNRLRNSVEVWDPAPGLQASSMIGQQQLVLLSVAFSYDRKSIASYPTNRGTARVWDLATGAERQHILKYTAASYDSSRPVAFFAGGKVIIMREAYGGGDVIGFWDTTTAQPEYTDLTPAFDGTHFQGHKSGWIQHYCLGAGNGPRYVCWLPQERRGILSYRGTKVCIRAEDGITLTILDFSHVGLPVPQQVV